MHACTLTLRCLATVPRDDKSFWGLKDPALALALVVAASTGAPAPQREWSRSVKASSEAANRAEAAAGAG